MQSGGGGPGRTAGRASTPSAAASPSSSSSASQLGFESLQQQHQQQQQQHQQQQQQQQIGSRQSFQQQLLRKPEGNEAFLAYQAGRQGVFGSNNFQQPNAMQLPQQSGKFVNLAQHGSNQDGQLRGQGSEQQQMINPVQQAYLQYAFQAAQQKQPALGIHSQQQAKMGMLNPASVKDQEMRMGNLKMQEAMSMQAVNQAQGSSSRNSSEHNARGEKQMEQGQQIRPIQAPEAQQGSVQNVMNTQIAVAHQLQMMQAWARENNIDLSHPTNANLMAKLIPMMQSRMVLPPKAGESNVGAQSSPVPVSKQQVNSPAVASESSAHANSSSDVSGQSGSSKARHTVPPSHLGPTTNAGHSSDMAMQQFNIHGRESQAPLRQQVKAGNGMPSMHSQQSSAAMNLGAADHSLNVKGLSSSAEPPQMQYIRQLNQSTAQAGGPTKEGGSRNNAKSQVPPAQMPERQSAFTKQQLHVLKAQILAFRRIKKGEGMLPPELLQAITPPPLEVQAEQPNQPAGGQNQVRSAGHIAAEQPRHVEANAKESKSIPAVNGHSSVKQESFSREEKSAPPPVHIQAVMPSMSKESASTSSAGKEEQKTIGSSFKPKQDSEHGNNSTPVRNESALDRGKAIAPQASVSDTMQITKPAQATTVSQPKDVGPARKYHGPLFDFPFFTRKHDSFGSSMMVNNNNNLSLAYDVKDLLSEEGAEVLNKKRTENLKKIEGLLAVNLERKRIRPDLVLRLQIEEKKLRLLDVQARLRDEIDQQQQEIMAMPDRPYRKFVRLCERQRMELVRQVQASQKAAREKQLKSIFLWRKKLLEAHWAIRDARTARNRGVGKYHERMLREFSKHKDDDRSKRLEALKNNDVDRYREMLLEQQTSIPGDAAERYTVLSSFLSQTEEYLHKLGSKITAAKNQQEVEEAAKAAADAARLQGLSEEEVRAAAACAGEEVMIRNRFLEMNAPRDSSSVNKYYNLAHAVNEMVIRQPSLLRAGTLRDYQLVGLQWMLSLYNNKLNGILADEMGLGKTVQVMALIAYLMEFKGNYGPHLIIVPNAVMVNWKSELYKWLPSVSCIFYAGGKDYRTKLFHQVSALKFNVLVTTYEFIMYDRAKLSKIDWKYIVIDEAQRMKDRDSVLARDLDRYRCQRRLLLTGTPLQNDLKELWSLLNLLLPEVFDNKKAFHDWFSKPFQKEGATQNAEDDWLETEKKVITIHRLHQILEPFMLRRRVEDVEGSLPPKDSIVLRCKMSSVQSAIYDWVKSTGTLRLDPEDEERKVQRNPNYQLKQYKTLNNRCMELRKTCNHPLLNYPFFSDLSKEFIVKSCGKLWILDRILIKLQRTGHRVLLFSTMTKLLDILEEYLQWRRLVYRRIDGTTSLEDRESAINDFNGPDSDCFIFLLSIRAAGRGLNLQSADTVVIYDPDPNPKNEEQAVARAHRIGQKRPVKVIYMEAVVDKIPSHQKEDEMRGRGTVDLEDELAGKDRYIGSIEGLIRNNIQQYKIDMADEVINAGRFDQRTTHEERRLTLETLLHDDERYQETVHDVPSLQEVNRMIARSEEEVELFDQMDDELDWIEEMTCYDHVPKWIRANSKEVNAAIGALSKRPLKKTLLGGSIAVNPSELGSERKRGRPKKHTSYKELDDEDLEYSEASSEERNGSANEEGEAGDFEDDGYSGADGAQPIAKDQLENSMLCDGGYEFPPSLEMVRNNQVVQDAGSSGSSADCQKLTQIVSPSISAQKFGSLSALDARPGSISKRMTDELEEGEIAVSFDSHMEHQQSGSWIHDRDEGEDEQVLQKPRIKRKRSIRVRPRHATEKPEDKSGSETIPRLSVQADRKYQAQLRADLESKSHVESNASRNEQNSSIKNKRTLPSRRVANTSKLHSSPKPTRLSAPSEDGGEHSRESWEGKPINSSGSSAHGSRMTEIIQRRCKNVISKLQRRIDKEGHQIVPLLTDLWKRIENSGYSGGSGNNLLDLRKIDQRIDKLEYTGATDLVFDVQFMLKSAMQYYGFSLEVRTEPRYPPPPSQSGSKSKQAPVSARKLAATLWEMNEIPSPSVKEMSDHVKMKKEVKAKDRVSTARSIRSGSLPPHLSDPSHSPPSERMDRSGIGNRHRRTPSNSHRLRLTEQHHHVGPLDSFSNASFMEIETRSRAQTPASSTVGVKPRLKDVSNALTTSKELLKIINRMWGHEDHPSSSMSLISALHTELERARLQVNQLIHEQRSDQNEINYLMKCFAEEKASWKTKEREIVEAAIESVAGELDVERKLRRRLESLNKKLGRELAETKASLLKVVKELETEKREREIIEKVCDELARDVDEDKTEIDKQRRVSTKACHEVEKEKEMMQLTDMLREERAQKKLSEAKYQHEEKNAAVDMLRNQLEAFLGSKQVREKGRSSTHLNDEEISAYLSRSRLVSHHTEYKEDDGEVDNGVECQEESGESDLHSIELNMDSNNKNYKWTYPSESRFDTRKYPIEEEIKGRRSISGRASRISTSLQRSISDGVEWGNQGDEKLQNSGDGIDWESFYELEKQAQGKSYGDEIQQSYKSVKGLKDQILAGSRLASSKGYASPTRQFSQPWPSRDPINSFQERHATMQGNGQKSRLGEARGEAHNLIRKSKR